jgi:hypothetical protein
LQTPAGPNDVVDEPEPPAASGAAKMRTNTQGQPGTFPSATSMPVGRFPAGIAAADLNGDGYPDLAIASFGSDSLGVILSQCR